MNLAETQAYIIHRLQTVGWRGDPSFSDDAYAAIHQYTLGVPRKINIVCDRLLLMGFLDGMHAFTGKEVANLIGELQEEFSSIPVQSGEAAD
jgi:type II secretory pathway predicted ATPase ExeA